MAGFQTHALIGAVAGLGLTRLAQPALALPVRLLVIAGAAVLATVPDIDEPNSWIARHVRSVIVLAATLLGALAGWFDLVVAGTVEGAPLRALLGAAVGAVLLGPLSAALLLRLIRRGAGGHRRLTHSALVALLLGVLAWVGYRLELRWLMLLPGALAAAIILHLPGDLVTAAGVPLFYPLSRVRIGLPRMLTRHGEPLIALAALAAGAWLL